MHDKYIVNVVTRYDQIFYFPNLVMTRFSHVGGWQVCYRGIKKFPYEVEILWPCLSYMYMYKII